MTIKGTSSVMGIDLTVIVPIYNEQETAVELLQRLFAVLKRSGLRYQVIAVDDGSTDNTGRILQEFRSHNKNEFELVLHKKNRGKGAAVHSGIKDALGEYTIIQDADLEYDPEDIIKLYKHAKRKDLPVLYGSRNIGHNKRGAFLFYWGGKIVTYVANILFQQRMTDEATCYKLIKTKLLRSISLQEKGFAFCPEVTARLAMLGIKIQEVPISYDPRSRSEGKKINWRDGLQAILTLVRLRFPSIDLHGLALLVGVMSFLVYLSTWHMSFGGYEGEIAHSAFRLLDGDFSTLRAGISAVALYIPFISLFRLLGLNSRAWLTLVPLVITAVTVMGTFYIAWYLSRKKYIALATSSFIALGSIAWPYTNVGIETQAALYITFLLLALVRWKNDKGSLWTVGILFALLAIAKSYGPMIGLPVLLFVWLAKKRNPHLHTRSHVRDLAVVIIPAAIAYVGSLALQYSQNSSLTGAYSLAHEFQIWLWWEGFYGIFFSIGKSIFLFSPLLILAVFYWRKFYRTHKEVAVFLLVSFGLFLLINAPFSYWTDETWGVRKLVPLLGLLYLPLISMFGPKSPKYSLKTIGITILLVLSVYVQILGSTYSYGKQFTILRDGNLDSLHHMRFTPQLSHVPLYHDLFINYLTGKSATLNYKEETWFRWTAQEDDLYLNNVHMDISKYQSPDIVWLSPGNPLQSKNMFSLLLIIDLILLLAVLHRYNLLRRADG